MLSCVLLLALLLVPLDDAFRVVGGGSLSARRRLRPLQSGGSGSSEEAGNKIKLPIVQLLDEKQELVGEFICGNDLQGALSKLRATLSSLAAASPPSPSDICERYVSNVYSDEQLTDLLESGNKLLVLKVYRDGCKKCAAMEPTYLEFAESFVSPRFKWLQAEVSNIPEHTAAIKLRLKGEVPPSSS